MNTLITLSLTPTQVRVILICIDMAIVKYFHTGTIRLECLAIKLQLEASLARVNESDKGDHQSLT